MRTAADGSFEEAVHDGPCSHDGDETGDEEHDAGCAKTSAACSSYTADEHVLGVPFAALAYGAAWGVCSCNGIELLDGIIVR